MNEGSRPSTQETLELCVAAHAALFLIGVSWAFGGNADWVRTPVSLWGSAGIAVFLACAFLPALRRRVAPGTLHWAWPVVVLNAIVAASCLTPGFRSVTLGHETFVMPVLVHWWRPSAAYPGLSLRALWLFDGIYFSCLNLALFATRRRILRFVLATAVANALALSVFGTVQKLTGATGIFFGTVPSPQVMFFASFVYDNHWGAFSVLMAGACIGLIIRYAHGSRGQGFFQGPAPAGLVAVFLIGLSVPLSGSRASTILLGALAAMALVRGIPRISRSLRLSGLTPMAVFAGMLAAAILASAAVWSFAGEVIGARAAKTRDQVAEMWSHGGIGSRSTLYHDTLRMARERILFGWGMGNFPPVFRLYNSQESKIDRIPVVYHDAHSDWLQSVAEVGILGTLLLGAAAALPLMSCRRSRMAPIPFFLLAGCALVAIYAWVEFPFGNVAVALAWWLCFFTAVQYTRLTAARGEHAPH